MDKPLLDHFGCSVSEDLMHMLLGNRLGTGSFREVYALRFSDDLVVKVETGKTFFNVTEWEVWNACPKEYTHWLAPCVHISDCGTCLVQKRVSPIAKRPANIPNWLDDNKLSNWGKFRNRLVCCDYGHHRLFKEGFGNHTLVEGSSLWRSPIVDV